MISLMHYLRGLIDNNTAINIQGNSVDQTLMRSSTDFLTKAVQLNSFQTDCIMLSLLRICGPNSCDNNTFDTALYALVSEKSIACTQTTFRDFHHLLLIL